jgi:ABC-type bacteriocin/lantibiotic exporter with double-glycine peptidase domain
MILFHTMDLNTFNASDRSSDGNMEFWTSLLRLLLFVFIGICCSLSAQHIDDTSGPSHEATQLLEGELEANYGVVSRSLPRQKKGVCTSRFIRFLAHIWPKSMGLQFAFHSRILLLLFQRGVNLYFPYLISVFLERIFQLKGDQKSTDAASQALYTYICFRVLETCLDVLQKSLWSRIVQSCRRHLASTALYRFLTQDEEWNQRHSTSEKSSAVGKARAVDKFVTEAIFGTLPTIVDLVLAIWFAANCFGVWCGFYFALTGLCLLCFLVWSGRRTADLEKTRSDAKKYTEDIRYGREFTKP